MYLCPSVYKHVAVEASRIQHYENKLILSEQNIKVYY